VKQKKKREKEKGKENPATHPALKWMRY